MLYPKYVYSMAGGWWNHKPVGLGFYGVALTWAFMIGNYAWSEEQRIELTQKKKSAERLNRFAELKAEPTDAKLIEILAKEAANRA